MNIALIGFRGTGKTTVARLLSEKMDKKLISTDEEIKRRIDTSIGNFVKKNGWEKFRDIESEVIDYFSDFDECILDTGGGVILRNENVINLKKNSIIILLTADLKIVTERLKGGKKRPALTKSNFIDEIEQVMNERKEKYKMAADYTIDTSSLSPEESCELISHYIQMEIK